MKTIHFKTNINCGACVAKVTPVLDDQKGISEWKVDTENPDKTLTVSGEDITESELIAVLAKAGYKATPLD